MYNMDKKPQKYETINMAEGSWNMLKNNVVVLDCYF